MSRTRFRMQQLEREVRASPVHWSEQSGDSSEGDQDEPDGVEHSPHHAAELQDYEIEDQETYANYELHRSHGKNPNHEGSRSPVMNRRHTNKYAAVTNEYRTQRESNESYHPETYVPKFQIDRQRQYDDIYQPQLYERKNTAHKFPGQVKDSTYDKMPLILTVLVVMVSIVCGSLLVSPSEENNRIGTEGMSAAVKDALSQYENIPEDVVFQVSAGIRSIVESDPSKPSIFVLLHNNTGDGPFCLANAIGNVAMEYLESDEKDPLILKPDELLQNENMSKDYGWIIEHYKPRIERHRSVIVTDLQEFPGRMAMAFHFLCDIYNPVVPKSLFLFTLRVENVYSKKVVEQAEKVMHRIWRNDVDNDQRQALITRLTEEIIPLPLNILHNAACP